MPGMVRWIMRILIAGASGLIGTALSSALRSDGHDVVALVRRAARVPSRVPVGPGRRPDRRHRPEGRGRGGQPLRRRNRRPALDPGADQRTPRSRLGATRTLAAAMARTDAPPAVFLSQSASGYYGNAGTAVLRENAPAGTGTLSRICVDWEAAAHEAPAGVRVVTPRTGVVLSRSGGALGRLLPLLRLGVGGPLGDGRQYWPWITLPDVAAAFSFLLSAPVSGPVNVCAPEAADVNSADRATGQGAAPAGGAAGPRPGAAAGDGQARRRAAAREPAAGAGGPGGATASPGSTRPSPRPPPGWRGTRLAAATSRAASAYRWRNRARDSARALISPGSTLSFGAWMSASGSSTPSRMISASGYVSANTLQSGIDPPCPRVVIGRAVGLEHRGAHGFKGRAADCRLERRPDGLEVHRDVDTPGRGGLEVV